MNLKIDRINSKISFRPYLLFRAFIFAVFLLGVIFLSSRNYLLFHTGIELFCIIIAFAMLTIAYNTYHVSKNHYFMFLGIAYGFIGSVFFIHALTYKGMNIFPGISANIPTQFWIIGRYMESLSFLASFFFLNRKLNIKKVVSIYALLFVILVLSVFYWGIFPNCYIEGSGLTAFKIGSEYVNSGILLLVIGLLVNHKKSFHSKVYHYLFFSLITTILTSLSFTFYVSVYGISNMLGHIFQLVSFYLLFRGIILTSLKNPYQFLYYRLNQINNKLTEKSLELEIKNQQLVDYNTEIKSQREDLEHAYKIIYDDIDKARKLHERFLPSTFPHIPGLKFASYYKPAKKLGGDFFNVQKLGDNKLFIYIADASGHGLDGAILNIFIRENINSYLLNSLKEPNESISPKKILDFLINQYAKENFPEEFYTCIFMAVIDLNTNVITYSNAGLHISPFLLTCAGEISRLTCAGIPIWGVLDNKLLPYEEYSLTLPLDYVLLFTTDGLIEEIKHGEMYGEERLEKVLVRNSCQPSPELIIEEINKDFYKFTGNIEGKDDITYLLIKQNTNSSQYLSKDNKRISS